MTHFTCGFLLTKARFRFKTSFNFIRSLAHVIFLMVTAMSVIVSGENSTSLPLPKNSYLVGSCMVFDQDLKLIMQLPGGQICVPQNDGSLLTLDGVKLRKFSGNIQELWAIDGEFHHQIAVVNEKIIALRAATIEAENKKIKHDFIVLLDQNGKIENQFSVRDWLIAIGKAPQIASLFPGSHQYTHINSIESHKDRLYFNDYVSGLVFSLKFDLTDPKFEWNWSEDSGLKTNVITRGHDFRWIQNGTRFSKMVFINKTPDPKNSDTEKKSDLGYRVSVSNSNSKIGKPKYYPELSFDTISTEHAGGALKIGNGILTTAVLSPVSQTIKETQVLWVDLKTAKVKAKWNIPFYIQDLELFDLSQFQKNSRFFTAALGTENSQQPNRTSLILKPTKASNLEKSFVFSFSSLENKASVPAASGSEGPTSAVTDKSKKVIEEKFNGGNLKIHLVAERKLNANQALSWAKNEAKKFESFFVEDVDPYSKKKTNYKECLIKRDLNSPSKNSRIDFYVGPENFWFQCFANNKSIKGFRTWIECDGKAYDLIVTHENAARLDVECSSSN